mmetsp:Transcript_53874/g.125915  ORF Transcript_53874/g.125915 Transcript_53874/m.125915 type:complete len:266 (-) Transcript_53874:126-923(-)
MLACPQSFLNLYWFQVVEGLVALLSLPSAQVILFQAWAWTARDVQYCLLVMAPPWLLSLARWPLQVWLVNRCRELVQAFQFSSVSTEMAELVNSDRCKVCTGLTAVLMLWYVGVVIWRYCSMPCGQFSFTAILTDGSALPCEVLEAVCSFHLVANGILCFGALAAGKAVQLYPSNFIPPQGGGIPKDLVNSLLSSTFDMSSTASTVCPICISDFTTEDRIRHLPCGHVFHTGCVDVWLSHACTCPMRCDVDIREVAHAKLLFKER